VDEALTTVFSFSHVYDYVPADLLEGVIQGADGNFYGTTYYDGQASSVRFGAATRVSGKLHTISPLPVFPFTSTFADYLGVL
jgi:hypothetical protein